MFVHPSALVLAPAVVLRPQVLLPTSLAALQRLSRSNPALRAAAIVGVAAALLGVALAVTGRRLVVGDASGGADGRLVATDLLSLDHLGFVARSMLLIGVPLLLGVLVLVPIGRTARRILLVVTGPSVLAVATYGFDLGFVRNADLVVALGVGVPAGAISLLRSAMASEVPRSFALLLLLAGLGPVAFIAAGRPFRAGGSGRETVATARSRTARR